MHKLMLKSVVSAAAILAVANPAWAHVLDGDPQGLHAGFLHPISGLDHVLAMVAVGLLAALMRGNALWQVPVGFVGMMLVGFALGIGGVPIPFVELGIVASVVAIGLAVALHRNWSAPGAVGLVGIFAIFHGHAHGTEMADGESALLYAIGFALATALLHGAGIGLALAAGGRRALVRAAGAVVSLAGLALVIA